MGVALLLSVVVIGFIGHDNGQMDAVKTASIVNLDEKPRQASFSVGLAGDEGKHLINLLSEDHSEANNRGKHTLMLEAYGYRWYRVGGLDYLLKRSDIDGVNVNHPE